METIIWHSYCEFILRHLPHKEYTAACFMLYIGSYLERLSKEDSKSLLEYLLYKSSEIGNESAVKIILSLKDEYDLEVNRLYCKHKTAAFIAAENGHTQCVKILRRNGAYANYNVKWRGNFDIRSIAEKEGYRI